MSGWMWWFVLGFAALIAELTTGTFYLMVVAAGLGAAGIAALLGAPLAVQLTVAAAIGFGGALWLRRSRGAAGSAASDPVQNMDVGQTVRVGQWSAARTARASYRGAEWDVELAPGEEPVPGDFTIRAIQSNRLVVARRADAH